MPPSISVNCMTRGPGPQVAAMLAILRPVVDEIVVAIDDRCDEELEAVLAPVADTLLRYPYAAPVDRPLPWLHAQCSGDWVLTIDDDEVPGAQLLDALRDVVSSGDCTHYLVPRRWLFPDADRYLDMSPWRLDYQLRIVQNDRRLLDFPTTLHQPIRVLGPGRRIEQPIYHLDCIQNARDVRERKARSYEQQLTGCRTAGRSLNHAYYVPERRENLATARVPAPDVALIRSVLAAREAPKVGPPHGGVRARAVSRDEIDRLWAGRGLSDEDYRARLTPLGDASHMRCGELRPLDVRIENLGGASWPAAGCSGPEIRLSYHWVRPETGERIERNKDSSLRRDRPGKHDHLACRRGGAAAPRPLAPRARPRPRAPAVVRLHDVPRRGRARRTQARDPAHRPDRRRPRGAATACPRRPGARAGAAHDGARAAARLVRRSGRSEPGALPPRGPASATLGRRAARRGTRGAGAEPGLGHAPRSPRRRSAPEIAEFLDVLAAAERLLLTSGRRALPPGDRVVALTTRLASMALGVKRATLRA